jgi:hypothetical protein
MPEPGVENKTITKAEKISPPKVCDQKDVNYVLISRA